MGEMVEKVARVLSTDGLRRYDISADKMVDCTWEQLDPLWREMYLRKARAAMAAMSEPSVAMCVAGLNSAHADRCKCGAPWSSTAGTAGKGWLIEETWSGFIHYIHRDFDGARWWAETQSIKNFPWEWRPTASGRGLTLHRRSPSIRFITKNADEAMRFPSRETAITWLVGQSPWLALSDQYQPREHEWCPTPPPPDPQVEGDKSREAPDPDLQAGGER